MSRRSLQYYFMKIDAPPVRPKTPWQKLWLVLNTIPDFFLCGLYLLTWISPKLTGGVAMVGGLMQVILLEVASLPASSIMTLVASGSDENALLGGKWERTKAVVFLCVGYGGLCYIYSRFMIHAWWPCLVLPGLVINRLMDVWTGRQLSEDAETFTDVRWRWGCACYLFLIFVFVFLPFPRLGITDEYLPRFIIQLANSTDKPWHLLPFGFTYYLIQTITDITRPKWLMKTSIRYHAEKID